MRWDVQWGALQDGKEAGLGRGTKMDCDAATSEAWACPKSGAGTAPQRCPKLKQRAEPLHSLAGGQWSRLPLWRMMDNVGQGPPPLPPKAKPGKRHSCEVVAANILNSWQDACLSQEKIWVTYDSVR